MYGEIDIVLVRRRGRKVVRGVRFGVVILRDVKKAARDRLEGPELGESYAFQIDDHECLTYWPTGGGRRGREDLGEDSFNIDEDSAPVFL